MDGAFGGLFRICAAGRKGADSTAARDVFANSRVCAGRGVFSNGRLLRKFPGRAKRGAIRIAAMAGGVDEPDTSCTTVAT